jgi:hypothetical protein
LNGGVGVLSSILAIRDGLHPREGGLIVEVGCIIDEAFFDARSGINDVIDGGLNKVSNAHDVLLVKIGLDRGLRGNGGRGVAVHTKGGEDLLAGDLGDVLGEEGLQVSGGIPVGGELDGSRR